MTQVNHHDIMHWQAPLACVPCLWSIRTNILHASKLAWAPSPMINLCFLDLSTITRWRCVGIDWPARQMYCVGWTSADVPKRKCRSAGHNDIITRFTHVFENGDPYPVAVTKNKLIVTQFLSSLPPSIMFYHHIPLPSHLVTLYYTPEDTFRLN